METVHRGEGRARKLRGKYLNGKVFSRANFFNSTNHSLLLFYQIQILFSLTV